VPLALLLGLGGLWILMRDSAEIEANMRTP
jgi:hypothetical protein